MMVDDRSPSDPGGSPQIPYVEPGLEALYARVQSLIDRRQEWIEPYQALIQELPLGMLRRTMQRQLTAVESCATPQAFFKSHSAVAMLPWLPASSTPLRSSSLLADWLDFHAVSEQQRSRLAKAFGYPLLVLCFLLTVGGVFEFWVKPSLQETMTSWEFVRRGDGENRANYSLFSLEAWSFEIVIELAIAAGIVWFFLSRYTLLPHRLFGRVISGGRAHLVAMSTLVSTLAELLKLDAPLPFALRLAGRQSHYALYRDAAERLAENFKSGSHASIPKSAMIRFSPLLVQSLSLGANRAPHLPMLFELSQLYRDRVRRQAEEYSALPSWAMLMAAVIVARFAIRVVGINAYILQMFLSY